MSRVHTAVRKSRNSLLVGIFALQKADVKTAEATLATKEAALQKSTVAREQGLRKYDTTQHCGEKYVNSVGKFLLVSVRSRPNSYVYVHRK